MQGFFVWCHQESNRGHKDFQSFALPTELWHHRFGIAKVDIIFYSPNYFATFFIFLWNVWNLRYLIPGAMLL